jgi:hypothetical protein
MKRIEAGLRYSVSPLLVLPQMGNQTTLTAKALVARLTHEVSHHMEVCADVGVLSNLAIHRTLLVIYVKPPRKTRVVIDGLDDVDRSLETIVSDMLRLTR